MNEEKIVRTYFMEVSYFSCRKRMCFIRSQTTVRKHYANLLAWRTKSNTPEQLKLDQSYVNVTLVSSKPAVQSNHLVINDFAQDM